MLYMMSQGANLSWLQVREEPTDFDAVFAVRFQSEWHIWYEFQFRQPYLIDVATLCCEI